jgi:hypothetical protein
VNSQSVRTSTSRCPERLAKPAVLSLSEIQWTSNQSSRHTPTVARKCLFDYEGVEDTRINSVPKPPKGGRTPSQLNSESNRFVPEDSAHGRAVK